MTVCAVAGCEREATSLFEIPEPVLLQWSVCEPHELELKVSPYSTSSDGSELIVGEAAPPRLIDYTIVSTASPDHLVTMVFGRDGVAEQTIQFFMTPEDARDISFWVAGPESKPGAADGQF